MRLLLVRHAIAVPRGTPGVSDDRRPLTPRGIRRFERAARGLARLLPRPDSLLTSPLARARQTAELLSAAWGGPPATVEDALAGGDFGALTAALDARRGRRLVALVGHEPHLSAVLARLLGTREAARLTFRKGGAALVELPDGMRPGGSLVWFLPPRVLRRLAR